MDFIKLECFKSVVDHQNYSLAAEELNLSQSSVSKHILQMEKELGVQLLERNTNHTRKVTLTEAGQAIIGDIEQLLKIYGEIEGKLARYQPRKEIRIGSVNHLQKVGGMAPIIAFMREYPEYHVSFEESDTLTLLSMLTKKEIDVAITAHIYTTYAKQGNLAGFPVTDYRTYTIAKDHYYLAVNRDHPLAARKQVDWSDLDSENLIILDKTFSSNRIIREALEQYHCRANISFETNGTDSIWGMILENYGVALLSRKVIRQMKGVVAVSMKRPINRDTVMLCPKQVSGPMEKFWEFFLNYEEDKNV